MHSALGDWITRMGHKWLWLLAFVPLFTDFLAAFIPPEVIPPQVAAWLKLIGTWQATLVFAGVGFVAAAFLVHRDMWRKERRLLSVLNDMENAVPKFRISLKWEGEPASDSPVIRMAPLPEWESVDALVQKERDTLAGTYAAAQRGGASITDAGSDAALMAVMGMQRINPKYEEEVEAYLKKYCEFLLCQREAALAKTRLQRCEIVVANIGGSSASSVHVQLQFPTGWLLDKQTEIKLLMARDDHEFCQKPSKPKPIITDVWARLGTGLFPSYFQDLIHIPDAHADIYEQSIHVDHAGATVSFTLKEVTPQQCIVMDERLLLWLGCIQGSSTVSIKYKVYAAQLHTPQVGTIEVQIRVE